MDFLSYIGHNRVLPADLQEPTSIALVRNSASSAGSLLQKAQNEENTFL